MSSINSHHGRITGTAGDSVLAEFASVVEAVDCAVKIQDALAAANEALPDEHRLRFRIGINVGDVMVKDGDIFGDGVNIAARLEALAEPGGICVSRGVRDHVRKMGRYAFEDLGEQSVKNIEQPIRAFRLRGVDATAAPASVRWRRLFRRQPTMAPPTGRPCSSKPVPPMKREFELAFWESIKDSQDAAEFAAYLEKYPDGHLRRPGRDAPQRASGGGGVRRTRSPKLDAVELAYWDTMKDSDNPDMFRAYLERYPDGAFAPLAKVRLEELGAPST